MFRTMLPVIRAIKRAAFFFFEIFEEFYTRRSSKRMKEGIRALIFELTCSFLIFWNYKEI